MATDEKNAGQPATAIRVGIEVTVTAELIPEHYFIEHGGPRDPDVQVQKLFGYMTSGGSLHLQGQGKQIKANGEPGSATRRVYVVSEAPDRLVQQVLDSVKASVAAEAEKYAAL